MILTNCAACAAPLAHNAPRCVRCHTRYCCETCLRNHAHRGGHDDETCAEIDRGGGAEQYHADKKYKEAVAEAVEACADDTKGQTCYICYCGGDEEGLVRGCACRGASGYAHVSCLARQAKMLREEAEEDNMDRRAQDERWQQWHACRLCKQEYHGVVACALGWACWKTYVCRPETDGLRRIAMNMLGIGLFAGNHGEEALSVQEAELSIWRRLDRDDAESNILIVQSNLANSYDALGRYEDALRMSRDVYSGRLKLSGEEHRSTLMAAANYASSLNRLLCFEEAKSLLRKTMPVARRVLGESDRLLLGMRQLFAVALYQDPAATLDDIREAVTTLEETVRTAQRVLGGAHPTTVLVEESLRNSQDALRARETPCPPAGSMADKIEIVRLDAEGNVKETLHDDFPAGWSAARTEFLKLRHGAAATAEGGWLELRVGRVSKMSTKRKKS